MNNFYHVLIWTHSPDKDGRYGDTNKEFDFDNLKDALVKYNQIDEFTNKILMRYESLDDDSDGEIIEECYKEFECVYCHERYETDNEMMLCQEHHMEFDGF